MNKENCALKLVDEIILYYDARSKKRQIARDIKDKLKVLTMEDVDRLFHRNSITCLHNLQRLC